MTIPAAPPVRVESLSGPQARFLAALLEAPSVGEAAKTARVSERQGFRWLAEPQFRAAFTEAKRFLVAQACARLQACAGVFVETLREVAQDADAAPSARVAAAGKGLELAFRAAEIEDVAERVAALESALAALQPAPAVDTRRQRAGAGVALNGNGLEKRIAILETAMETAVRALPLSLAVWEDALRFVLRGIPEQLAPEVEATLRRVPRGSSWVPLLAAALDALPEPERRAYQAMLREVLDRVRAEQAEQAEQ